MRRRLRHAFNLAAAVSALLFVATAVFWVRSYRVLDDPLWERGRWYILQTVPGGFQFNVGWTYRKVGTDDGSEIEKRNRSDILIRYNGISRVRKS